MTPAVPSLSMLGLVAVLVAACATPVPPPASATPGATPTPRLTDVPAGTPPPPSLGARRAAAQPQVVDVATTWVTALRRRDFETAWRLLAPSTRQAFGSYERFASDQAATLDTAKDEILDPAIDPDPDAVTTWLPAAPDVADVELAFVVSIEYPVLTPFNNGTQILLVAPDASGEWRISIVR